MHALIPACCGSFLQPSANAHLRGQVKNGPRDACTYTCVLRFVFAAAFCTWSNGPRHRNGDDASPAAHVGCRQRAHSRIALVRATAKAAGRNGCLRRLFTSSNTAQPCTAVPRPNYCRNEIKCIRPCAACNQGLGILVHGMQSWANACEPFFFSGGLFEPSTRGPSAAASYRAAWGCSRSASRQAAGHRRARVMQEVLPGRCLPPPVPTLGGGP